MLMSAWFLSPSNWLIVLTVAGYIRLFANVQLSVDVRAGSVPKIPPVRRQDLFSPSYCTQLFEDIVLFFDLVILA